MCARPRKVTDEDLYAATYRAMTRLGPGELTLAEIAREAGVTPAVLVQRFGSKRALLLALAEQHAGSADAFMHELAQRHESPLTALRAYAECMSQLATTPAAFARTLAYLQIDLEDEDFRRHLLRNAKATRAGLQRLVAAAIEAGELRRDTDAGRLAEVLEALVSGSMMTWAFYRKGTAASWVRGHLDAVLEPHLARARR
jgi:AcrR family transcriptional regulator